MSRPSYAPEPDDTHSQFIDNLGGPKAVADAVNVRLDIRPPLTGQAVSMWKVRGIPYRYRGPLVVLAQSKDVEVPPDFFGTGVE